jgi:ABC-type transport system substrate-binding protein
MEYQQWLSRYLVTGTGPKGDYDGITIGGLSLPAELHIGQQLLRAMHSKGPVATTRRWDDTQDKLDAIIDKILVEFDDAKVKDLTQEYQRLAAPYMSSVPTWYHTSPFSMSWPWVVETGWQGGGGSATNVQVWYDESKRKA